MNTITLNTKASDGTELAVITYTELEVSNFVRKAEEADRLQDTVWKLKEKIDEGRNQVRDFFLGAIWDNGSLEVSRDEINELLEGIGARRLVTNYRGTVTIHLTFNGVEAESADEAQELVENDINVEFYGGTVDVESVEVFDVEEDN